LQIVTELYMREMSPSQFHREFGGGTLSRVNQNFKTLEKGGWLRYIRSERPKGRRGSDEHFYRATELAIFDDETWALLPYSIRIAFSWRSFQQLVEKFREAMKAGTFDARKDRHFTWTPLLLDQLGWDRVLEAMDILFLSLFEEQEDAKARIPLSEEESMRASVVLTAFESPLKGSSRVRPKLIEDIWDSLTPFPTRLSRVFADELCLKIVAELNLRDMSVSEFHREFGGGSRWSIGRRFKLLKELGWIRKAYEKKGGKRRGARERFYRATMPAIYDNASWSEIPDSERETDSQKTLKQLCEQVEKAMRAGTFDARKDRYLTWSLFRLDQRGWEKVIAGIEALFAFIFEEQARANERMAGSDDKPIRMTVALAAFESPKEPVKEL
jgi:hypothetical protein